MSPATARLRAAWVADSVLDHAGDVTSGRSAGPGAVPGSKPARTRRDSTDSQPAAGSADTHGTVLGRFGATFHVELGDFVVVLQPADATRMSNGIGISLRNADQLTQAGQPAAIRPGGMTAGSIEVSWDALRPPAWSSAISQWTRSEIRRATGRGRSILAAIGQADEKSTMPLIDGFAPGDEAAGAALDLLHDAVWRMDVEAAAAASALLVGRGSGLTPIGDDVLAAAALTIHAIGEASGCSASKVHAFAKALAPTGVHQRTTPISATLLALAGRGRAIRPAQTLLDPRPLSTEALGATVRELDSLGHSTGGAYVNTIGALAQVLSAPAQPTMQPTKEYAR